MGNVTRVCTAAAILLVLSGRVWAANLVSVGAVTANAGDSVAIPLSIATDREMTLLSVDITADPALCGMIQNQVVVKGPAANKDPEEGGEQCPTTRVVLFDLSGTPVIKPGSGVIAEWTFNVRPDAPGGVFPLRLSVNRSNDGPAPVPLTPTGGQLTLVAQEGTAPGSQPAPAVVAAGGQPAAPVEPHVGAPVESGGNAPPEAKAGTTSNRVVGLGALPPTPLPDGGNAAGEVPSAGGAQLAAESAGGAPATPESAAGQQAPAAGTAIPQPPATPQAAKPQAAAPQAAETPGATTVPEAPTMTAAPVATRTPPFTATVAPTPARSGSCAIAPPDGDRRCGAFLLIAVMFFIVRKRRARSLADRSR